MKKEGVCQYSCYGPSSIPEGSGSRAPSWLLMNSQKCISESSGTGEVKAKAHLTQWAYGSGSWFAPLALSFVVKRLRCLWDSFHRLTNLTPECSNLLSWPPPRCLTLTINPSWHLGLQQMSFGEDKRSVCSKRYCKEEVWGQMRGVCLGSVSIYTSGCVITHRGAVVWAPGVAPGHIYLLGIRHNSSESLSHHVDCHILRSSNWVVQSYVIERDDKKLSRNKSSLLPTLNLQRPNINSKSNV